MILHVDMDAFYASVELRDHPELNGKPVVVGGSPQGRGVISAASYEARKYGVHSAMSSAQALRLCPQLVFVRPRMEHYAAISKQIREIFFRYTPLVEPISLDEAFLDVAGSERLFGDAISIAKDLKSRIRTETGLTASAGVAPNKYLAKLASDLNKPDGLTVVPSDAIRSFLDPLSIARVWGVGRQTLKKFDALGIRTIGQLRQLSLESLKGFLGLNGEHFWRLARGIDSRLVVPDRDAKSISHETTFHIDIEDEEVLRAWLLELTDQVTRRMRRYHIRGRTVQLKMRYSNFETITRAQSLVEPCNVSREISDVVLELFDRNKSQISRGIRLLGVGVSHLASDEARQLSLFDEADHRRHQRMDAATDQVRDRFGKDSLMRAANLQHQIHYRPDPNKRNS